MAPPVPPPAVPPILTGTEVWRDGFYIKSLEWWPFQGCTTPNEYFVRDRTATVPEPMPHRQILSNSLSLSLTLSLSLSLFVLLVGSVSYVHPPTYIDVAACSLSNMIEPYLCTQTCARLSRSGTSHLRPAVLFPAPRSSTGRLFLWGGDAGVVESWARD